VRTVRAWAMPMRPFSFSTLAAGGSSTIVLAPAVGVEILRELALLVHVYVFGAPLGASLRVVAVAAAPTEEQPDVLYPGNVELAAVSLAGSGAGSLLRAELHPPLPTHVQLRMLAVGADPPNAFRTTIAALLEGKA
jgi:hypothetical protein